MRASAPSGESVAPWEQMLSRTIAPEAAAHLVPRCCTRDGLEAGA